MTISLQKIIIFSFIPLMFFGNISKTYAIDFAHLLPAVNQPTLQPLVGIYFTKVRWLPASPVVPSSLNNCEEDFRARNEGDVSGPSSNGGETIQNAYNQYGLTSTPITGFTDINRGVPFSLTIPSTSEYLSNVKICLTSLTTTRVVAQYTTNDILVPTNSMHNVYMTEVIFRIRANQVSDLNGYTKIAAIRSELEAETFASPEYYNVEAKAGAAIGEFLLNNSYVDGLKIKDVLGGDDATILFGGLTASDSSTATNSFNIVYTTNYNGIERFKNTTADTSSGHAIITAAKSIKYNEFLPSPPPNLTTVKSYYDKINTLKDITPAIYNYGGSSYYRSLTFPTSGFGHKGLRMHPATPFIFSNNGLSLNFVPLDQLTYTTLPPLNTIDTTGITNLDLTSLVDATARENAGILGKLFLPKQATLEKLQETFNDAQRRLPFAFIIPIISVFNYEKPAGPDNSLSINLLGVEHQLIAFADFNSSGALGVNDGVLLMEQVLRILMYLIFGYFVVKRFRFSE